MSGFSKLGIDKKSVLTRPRPNVQQIRPKANLPSGSFIALGARPNTPDVNPSSGSQSSGSSVKREGSTIVGSSFVAPAKKPRIAGRDIGETRQTVSPSGTVLVPVVKRDISADSLWQGVPNDVTPTIFVNRLRAAEEKGRPEKAEKLVLGLVKFLYDNRTKPPDPTIAGNICLLAREKPQYFREPVIEALCALLRKPFAIKPSAKSHPLVHQLVCSSLYRALCDREEWPESLVRTYLDDALTDRAWVDRKDCASLVQDILTAFGTQQPPAEFFAYLYYGEGSRSSIDHAGCGSPVHGSSSPLDDDDNRSRDAVDVAAPQSKLDDDSSIGDDSSMIGESSATSAARRTCFAKSADAIRDFTLDLLRDWWSRRLDTVSKPLVKTMSVCCGYPEVRLMAAQKLDTWLQNAKLQRAATELMMFVCMNIQDDVDIETLSCLTRLRFKSRIVAHNFCYILKELFARVPSVLSAILKLVIHNELSTTRAPHNMLIIGQCFQFDPDESSQTLAAVCFELLSSPKEDYSRALRAFLREIVRNALKFEFPINAFCRALFQERNTASLSDFAVKERMFHALEDLICLSAFLGMGPAIRDAALAVGRGDRREIAMLNNYQRNITQLQCDAVAWLHSSVPLLFRPSKDDYLRSFYRVTFLEKPEFYSSKDNWPTDQERNLCLKIIADAGLEEDLLIRIFTAGLSPDNMLSSSAALDITEQLVRRAAAAVFDPKFGIPDQNLLKVNNPTIIDLLFNCCRYRPPDSYQLPTNYTPPLLAITSLFWKSGIILLILAACNPGLFGRIIWENYPTLQYLMEMTISGDYNFPPVTILTETVTSDHIKQQELQIIELEKQEILELEGYLATDVVITESNSSLLAHLTRLQPKGEPRRPPSAIIEAVKQLDQQLNIGLAFCRSRDPDFLLEIITRQGSSHSLPWLVQLIQKNEGSLAFLPAQCLCEFLLHHLENEKLAEEGAYEMTPASSKASELQNSKELRQRLIDMVWKETEHPIEVEKTLLYFFNRLQADTKHDRDVAVYALQILLKMPGDSELSTQSTKRDFTWLLRNFPFIPHFSTIRSKAIDILSKCTTIETDLPLLHAHIAFLHEHIIESELDDVILNLGKLINGRRAIVDSLLSKKQPTASQTLSYLLDLFRKHLAQVRNAHSDVIRWSANQDQLLVQWGETASAVMNVNVVAAMFLLLGHSKPADDVCYDELMEAWFPQSDDLKPEAFMIDTSEQAELMPEDVKFQLLRSTNDAIVDSVLQTMDIRQKLTCIEYSGLPPETVSKVCQSLDVIVRENVDVFDELSIRAKTWLAFLISHAYRGAVIGTNFVDWCKKNALGTSKPSTGLVAEAI